jgi:hypothetical protein
MGLNPGWRQAIAHFILSIGIPEEATKEELDEARARGRKAMDRLSQIAPGLGAYLNEADWVRPFELKFASLVCFAQRWRRKQEEPEWQNVFWGDNYPRLLEIKKKIDPKGLFTCNRCVGSEMYGTAIL